MGSRASPGAAAGCVRPSRIALRVVAALWLIATVGVSLSVVTGVLSRAVAGVAASLFILMFLAITFALFRSTPEWRARHEKLIILKERRAKSSEATRAVAESEHDRHDVDNREKKAVEKITKQADKARTSEQKELADVNTRLAAKIQKLDKQKQKLQSSESMEAGNALRLLQQQHVTAHLRAARISSAGIPGIGPGIMSSLAMNGITSAGDFTGLYYETGPRGGEQVFISLRNGTAVHPTGVGAKKAGDLDNWRRRIERAAMATQPSSLPPARLRRLEPSSSDRRLPTRRKRPPRPSHR